MAQIFVANMKEFDGMNKAQGRLGRRRQRAPRATVEARLANPDTKVEIVVTAAVAKPGQRVLPVVRAQQRSHRSGRSCAMGSGSAKKCSGLCAKNSASSVAA